MPTPKHLRGHKRLALFLALLFFFNTLFPTGFAAARVLLMAKPGLGVSRVPLSAMAFDAPGFGNLAEAVNLANGNLYVAVDALSTNTRTAEEGAETTDAIGNSGWNFTARLKLNGFSSGMTQAPASLTLESGDQSISVFERVAPSVCGEVFPNLDFETAPSWIERYEHRSLRCDRAFYRLTAEPGLSYAETYVVLETGDDAVAHYYAVDGTRTTFHEDSYYADFSQTLHQQYQGALRGDPEGTGNSPKTEYRYEDTMFGRIDSVTDAYGRVTKYKWGTRHNARVLTDVYYLLSNGTSPSKAARTIHLDYAKIEANTVGNIRINEQVVVETVTYTASDGRDGANTQSRTVEFSYYNDGFLETTTRETAGGDLVTAYTYDSDYRVSSVGQTGLPTQFYDYGGISQEYGGTLVTITQGKQSTEGDGVKNSEYHFDEANKLRKKMIKDVHPNGTSKELVWRYAYYKSGNVGLVEEPSGRFTHFGYDARGNVQSESVYLDRKYYDGELRLPVTVGLKSPTNRLTYGTNDTFTLEATVGRDELKRGVRWSYINSAGKEMPLKLGATGTTFIPVGSTFVPIGSSIPLTLQSVRTNDGSGESYKVTATFKVDKDLPQKRRVEVRATSNRDKGEGAKAFINLSPRIKKVQIKTKANKLIAALNCVRPPNEIHKTLDECGAAYQIFDMSGTKAVVEDWVTNSSQYRGVDFEILEYSYRTVPGAVAPLIYSDGRLVVYWRKALAERAVRGISETITIGVTSKAEPSKKHKVKIPVSFFAIAKTKMREAGNWDIPRVSRLADSSTYQYAVDVYNSPYRGLEIEWKSYRPKVGDFKPNHPGCFRTNGKGIYDHGTWIRAFVKDMPSVYVQQYETVTWVWQTWDIGEKCSPLNEYGEGNGTTNGFANRDTALSPQSKGIVKPLNESSGTYETFAKIDEKAPSPFSNEERDLSNEPNKGFYHQTLFTYDRDNRLKEVQTPAPLVENIEGLNHAYENLTETSTPAYYSYTTNYQTFSAPSSLTTRVKVGETAKRTTVNAFKTDGLLASSKLMWGSDYRKETYSYYNTGDTVSLVVPGADGLGSVSVKQYGDMLKQITTTSSHKPVHAESADTRIQTFAYDALGHLAEETLSGVVSDVNPLKRETRTVQRAFNGYSQPVWERVKLGNAIASEQGFTYHASGDLLSEWAGTPSNLTIYSYFSGDKVGLVKSVQRGVAGENGSLETVRDQVDYGYDTFRRLESETVVASGDETYKTSYVYDTLDRITETTLPDPDSSTVETTYDLHGEIATLDEPRVSRSYLRNPLGYLTKETVSPTDGVSEGHSVEYKHDVFGRVVYALPSDKSINPEASDRASLFRYDTEGNLRCEIGPVMRSADHAVATEDSRRPGVSYVYDALGRKESETRVLYGELDVVGSCNLMSDKGNIATTTYQYDGFGNVELIVDAEGYRTESAYDAAGQTFVSRRQIDGAKYAEVWTAFDGAGRPTKVKDPLTYTRESRYDRLGNVLEEVNEAGYTIKRYSYTKDGLLEGVKEPQMTEGTGDNSAANDTPMVTTLINLYEKQRPYPTKTYRAHMDSTPSKGTTGSVSGGTETQYDYDWAGQITTTTLDDEATIVQAYDHAGNVTTLKSADGFTTTYVYDYANRLLEETKHAREGNDIDTAAGLGAGLTSRYRYDVSGNLTREEKQGLITTYVYNSLGEVIAESRPKRGEQSTRFKRYAYRLDGVQTAATSYTYEDAGTLEAEQRIELADGVSSFTAGSIETYGLDKLGRVISERTEGVRPEQAVSETSDDSQEPNITLSGVVLEKRITYKRNGLGLATERTLDDRSAPDIYSNLRDPGTGGFLKEAASRPVVGYTTHYNYSSRGELLEQYDAIGFVDWTSTKTANYFKYTYTPTGKEKTAWRDLSVRVRRWQGPDKNFEQESVLLAATKGTVTSRYNERDLLKSTDVEDQAAEGRNALEATAITQNATYAYYPDGNKREVMIGDEATTYQYDARSRIVGVEDSNGTTARSYAGNESGGTWSRYTPVGNGSADIRTQYSGDTVTTAITWSSGCSYTKTETYALESYKYIDEILNSCSISGNEMASSASSSSTTTYTADGLIDGVSGSSSYYLKLPSDAVSNYVRVTNSYSTPNESDGKAFVYDDFNQLTARKKKSASSDFSYREWYEDTETSDTYDANCECFPEKEVMKKRTVKVKGSTELNEETFTYTEDGHLLFEAITISAINPDTGKVNTGSSDTKESRYLLDSVGNRRSVQGGDYDGFIKRYNAEGRVSMFYRYQEEGAQYYAGGQGAYSDFVYDPAGNLVLSATSTIHQTEKDRMLFLLQRDSNSVYTSEGEVQLLRKRWNAKRKQDWEDVDWKENQTLWNHTFSLADGIHSQVAWSAPELFEVTAPSRPLAAPTTSISDRLGVAPADVVAPDTALPDLTPDEVLPPVDDPDSTSEGEGVSIQARGWTGNGLSALKPIGGKDDTPATRQWGGAAMEAGAATEEETSIASTTAQDEPQEPSTVLPEVLNTTDALDVIMPESLNAPLPSVGDATEVLPPGEKTPPGIGTGTSDGPLDIVPPAEIQQPDLPTIGTTPDAIAEVAPPLGWQANNASIDAFTGRSSGSRTCKTDPVSGVKICGSPRNVDQALKDIQNGTLDLTGGRKKQLDADLDIAIEFVAALTEGLELNLADEDVTNVLNRMRSITGYTKSEHVELIKEFAKSLYVMSAIDSNQTAKAFEGFAHSIMWAGETPSRDNLSLKRAFADFNKQTQHMVDGLDNDYRIAKAVGTALETWDRVDRDYLSFDSPFQMEETWWSSMLGVQDGTRLDGTVGTRISVGLAIDVLLIGVTGGVSLGRKFATKGAVELGENAAQNAALKNVDDLSWEQMVARATCGANSFSADTPVATPYGLIAIATLVKEKIQEVFGYNEETGEVDVFTVTHYHIHDDPITYDIVVDDDVTDNIPGELIETTPEHPFYVLDEWVDAEDLEVGMPLSTYEGTNLIHSGTVTSIERIEETQTMYNLTVDTAHTFFVGEGEWLVHNTGGQGPCGLSPNLTGIYNAGGDPALRSLRRPEFDNWLQNGLQVGGDTYSLNPHAYNRLFKSGRKDIMPADVYDALATANPLQAQPGSVMYVNPTTGTKVFVNPTTQDIVGVQPSSFK